MTTAKELTNQIITYLNYRRCYVWRNQTIGLVRGHAYSNKLGVADIVGMTESGRHVEVEVKVGSDKIRPEQQRHSDAVKSKGAIYLIARTFADFEKQWIAISSDTEVSRAGDQPHLVPVRRSKQPTPTGKQ